MTRRFPARRRAGFTLIEILVVLALAAVITGITVGGFREMSQGNKRVSCQTNLVQIYQAARLYAADEGGKFPYYDTNCTTSSGIGLWSLYTFADKTDIDGDGKTFDEPAPVQAGAPAAETGVPIERYLRSAKVLHCPSDSTEDASGYRNTNLFSADGKELNPGYLTYQTCDGGVPTYLPKRDDTPNAPANDPHWKRQLLHFDGTTYVSRQPADTTIVTWCFHHRNQRGLDNVLFYDGSVQQVPQTYNGNTGWQRLPKPPQ